MIWCGSPIVEIYFTCLSFVLSKLIQHWIAGLRVRSFMTWLGAALFFWRNFLAVYVRSFAGIKSCFANACDIQIIQHLSSHPMFLQSITFCSLLVHMGSLTALRDTFVCFWPQIRKCSRAWCSFDYMMLGFHEILTFQKAIFHSICLRWTNFNETPLMSGITLTLFFRLSIRVK